MSDDRKKKNTYHIKDGLTFVVGPPDSFPEYPDAPPPRRQAPPAQTQTANPHERGNPYSTFDHGAFSSSHPGVYEPRGYSQAPPPKMGFWDTVSNGIGAILGIFFK